MLFLTATANYNYHNRSPRCIGSQSYEKHKIDNQTIHLVHGPQLWSQRQLRILDKIADNYPKCKIHLVIITDEERNEIQKVEEIEVAEFDLEFTTVSGVSNVSTTSNSKLKHPKKFRKQVMNLKRIRRWMKKNLEKKGANIKAENGKSKLQNSTEIKTTSVPPSTDKIFRSLGEILRNYPQIFLEHLDYEESFMNSPLYKSWRHLSPSMRLFAIRVLYLWQYGGLSFSLAKEDTIKNLYEYETTKSETNTPTSGVIEIAFSSIDKPENNLEKLIASGFTTFKNMPSGIVTIDDAGLHMETKTSCHAFFGDLLANLRKADENSTPSTVIKQTLETFCKRNAVDSKYCASIKG